MTHPANRPRRFYTAVSVAPGEGEFHVLLDGRPSRSPGGSAQPLPSRALAEAIAGEWRAQGEKIDRRAMPLARLADLARDSAARDRAGFVDRVAAHAESDLLCYRAAHPEALARRQAACWQPLLDWVAARYGAALAVTAGISPVRQDPAALAALRRAVESADMWALAALHEAARACGSAVLALALRERRLNAEGAAAASQLDERFQAERWGEDAEAAARRAALAANIAAAARFLALLES